MSISLRAMRYFTVALRLGSISRAAERLNVSASAISAAIDQIESHFDLTLTVRQRARGIVATTDGRAMAQRFEALLEEYDSVLLDGVARRHSLQGDLSIGYYAPVAPAFLPRILEPLMRPENDLTVHLHACDNTAALEGLRRGRYDAILCVAEGAEPGFRFEPLISAPAYCLMSTDHRLAREEAVALADLEGEPIMGLDRPLAAEYYAGLLKGEQPRMIGYSNSSEMIRSVVGTGQACAILNMLPLTDTSYAGDRLVARPLSDALPPLTLSLGYRVPKPRRAVSEFVRQCKAHFARPEAGAYIVGGPPRHAS